MLKRIISALLAIPLFIFIINRGGILLYGTVMVLSLLGLKEYYNAMTVKGYKPFAWAGYLLSVTIVSIFYYMLDIRFFLFSIVVFIIIFSVIILITSQYNVLDGSVTLFGVVYVTIFLSHILLTDQTKNSASIWLIFTIAWSTDTFAYFIGYLFGKTKLCPEISPKKTVEGAVGGLLGSFLFCTLVGYLFFREHIIYISILGIIGSIMAQTGDLTASRIKRYAGIKDFGKIMPGHGGILDRFDSILFVAPTVYYYLIFVLKI